MSRLTSTLANVAWAADFVASEGDQAPAKHMTEWSRENRIQLDQRSALALAGAARLEAIREAPADVRGSYLQHLQVAQHDACGVLDFFRTPTSAPKASSTEQLQAVIESLLKQLQEARSKVAELEASNAKCEYLRTTQPAVTQHSGPASAIAALPAAVRPKPPTSALPPTPSRPAAPSAPAAIETPPVLVPQSAGPPPPPPMPIFGRPKVPARSPPRRQTAPPAAPKRQDTAYQPMPTLLDSEEAKRLIRRAQLLQGNDPKTEDTDADWSAASISGSLDATASTFIVHQVCEAGQIHSYYCS